MVTTPPSPRLALTIWQPYASLIIMGLKFVEWRSWTYPVALIGQPVVIHAGAKPPKAMIRELLATPGAIAETCGPGADVDAARAALERMAANPHALPLSAGIGQAVLGAPAGAADLYARHGLNLDGPGGMIGWPMLDPVAWPAPVPAQGALRLWPWRAGGA